MKSILNALRAGTVVLFVAALSMQSALAKDKTIDFRTGDPEMAAAITDARASLPEFWKMFKTPDAGVRDFSLKVAISEPKNPHTEHFWLGSIERKAGDKLSGIINNDPNYIKSVKRGQRYEFTEAKVTDWLFYRNGKIVGAYTLRPMIKRMPKDQAVRYRSLLEKP